MRGSGDTRRNSLFAPTTKVCIVFGGSAKVDQRTSLNEAPYLGPSLSCMIFDILL